MSQIFEQSIPQGKYLPANYFLLKISLLLCLLFTQSCQQDQVRSKKVLVVHARGIAYPDLKAYLEAPGENSFFEEQQKKGNILKLQPITNAVTISNIASFETGVLPSVHGIIGHAFGLRADQTIKPVSGFGQRFSVESFWEKADKQGKKVLNVGALILHGQYEQHQYKLIITSGHGFSPIHTSIDINKLLTLNGINTNIKEETWEAVGIPGKVSAHVYLNDQMGVDNKESVLEKIKGIIEDQLISSSQESMVDTFYSEAALKNIGLDHDSAGDLFILLKPGYIFENTGDDNAKIFDLPTFKGDHGYSLKYEESFGILITENSCDPCKSIDVAKMITDQLKLID